ncbi:MAG: phenylalanine--tRNA ligase subunit beta [Clostridiales bacterium]|nr:phenylalanine--tRNA ligase subunit beta [Clostridiales bacterium]
MFVSMNWINDYVDLSGLDLVELIHRFTLSTAEVEDIYLKGSDIDKVVAGKILSVEKHPDSKKLHLLKVDVGEEVLDIVCGAPNVREGMVVPVALEGGRVCAGEIKKAVIAGYESRGMCCSEMELGISDDHSGLMEIADDVKIGADICDIYPIKDIVFEVDNKSLTNRPDLWGHYGIAREFAAITKRPLKPIPVDESVYEGEEVPVEVKSDLVYRYSALRVENITKTVSPVAMRIRLYYCGMRGINFLADLTNYIMLEMGQPMHAFDGKKVDSIAIGTPAEKGKFTTLDGTEREIDENTLLIYNNDEPVAIAGIMGGLDSEIVGNTDSVVIESANFNGISVRKTSSRLGLRTDASMRYEKILDPEMTVTAIRRMMKLMKETDPDCKVVSSLADKYVKKYEPVELKFNKAYVDRYTGIEIGNDMIVETLTDLGFGVKLENDEFTVDVPSWRATKDVTIKADIIEEITRIYGYDNFEITTTKSPLRPVRAEAVKSEDALIKDLLVNKFNLHEVHSYIWCDGKKYKKLGIEVEENCRILNIPTPENGTLRNSMIPTLLTMVYENKSYAPSFGIFECGRVVDGYLENGYCRERRHLGIVLFDKVGTEKELYFKTLNMLKFIFSDIKHDEAEFAKAAEVSHPYQHPKNTAVMSYKGKKIGEMFTLHPMNNQKIDRNAAIVCAEIDLDDFFGIEVKEAEYKDPSKFPAIDYDLSLLLTKGERFADIKTAWESLNIPSLASVKVIDIFDVGKAKSMTLRLSFSLPDRTLSMEETQTQVDSILGELGKMGIELKK